MKDRVFLSFYGDDFTGSTDVMESLTLNGIPAVLFLNPPDPEELEGFRMKRSWNPEGDTRPEAFGVAGVSRSMHVSKMEEELPGIFEKISAIPAQYFHYKVCSTFDSSPTIGNIGVAVDIAERYFPSAFIPLLIAAPPLNRFSIFGNLFARIDGVTYRLDRHPTMSKHPVTPMKESDLRVHLGEQTDRPVELFDLFALDSDYQEQKEVFHRIKREKGELILFDTYTKEHLKNVGRLLFEMRGAAPQLLVGSSGIEYALTGYMQAQGKISKPTDYAYPGKADRMIIMAGSCAPTTRLQLEWSLEKGFEGIRIDTERLVDPASKETVITETVDKAVCLLENGVNPAIYTALGPDDPAIGKTNDVLSRLGLKDSGSSEHIASTQGIMLKRILEGVKERIRVVVAGGDTSGHVSRALEITALETLVPIAPGAPLCLAHSSDSRFDGMEISLKGGQNGKKRYFESILEGKALE
jgi:uncharacterized protein YgbK (DUF1537 family)